MARRSGSFSGSGGLDPFGGSRGGLGRYNVTGESIQSLAEYDAYVTATAWANGKATDAEYLASLQSLVDLASPNTRERVGAENKLADAQYSIGRNAIASEVNRADTPAQRTTALRHLLAYDTTRLGQMDAGNQAFTAQQDRVSGVRVDIRQSQYSELVNKVNAGKATTEALLTMARNFRNASSGDPDNGDWNTTVDSLVERVADEDMTEAFQAYQHNRMTGAKLMSKLNARIASMTPGSPAYQDLVRQREDLQTQLHDRARTERAAKINGQRAEGKVTDSGYLKYLRDEYNAAPAGTAEKIESGNRLREFTFSIAEDKLRFDVQKGKRPVSSLISFYKAARAGMDRNSERYRALTLAIDSLAHGAGSGGGSGRHRAGGKAGKGVTFYSKQLVAEGALHDIIGGAKAPPDFGGLFHIDITSMKQRRWWDNNVRSAVAAYQDGARTWTYYDKHGQGHELPFSPTMMRQFDQMNLAYSRDGLAGAKDMKDRQFWTGKIITATKALSNRGGQYTMDVYQKTFGDLESAKQAAMAGARWAEYANLTKQQMELARFILGGTLDPDASTNPYLDDKARNRIARDLAHIAPQQNDAAAPDYNPDGDIVLSMMGDQRIAISVDSEGNAVSGQLDPNFGYLTQADDGRIMVKPWDINASGGSELDPQLNREVPAYLSQTAPALVRTNGQDIEVRQPTMDGGASLPVYVSKTGVATDAGANPTRGFVDYIVAGATASIPGKATSVDPYIVNGQLATIPLKSFTTREGTTTVRWVSIDGKTWVRYVPGEVPPPRVVIGSDLTFDGKKWQKDGKDIDASAAIATAHWWGAEDSQASGKAWGVGGPGMTYSTRTAHEDGTIDTRPNWMFAETKVSGKLQYDQGESTSQRRGYYFDTEERVAAAKAAARFSINPDQSDLGPTGSGVYGPSHKAYQPQPGERFVTSDRDPGQWSSDLVPAGARYANTGHAPGRGPLLGDTPQVNIGYKRPPNPTLAPPPTPSLAPVTAKPIAELRQLAAPKLPTLPKPPAPKYNGPTGKTAVAQQKAALAAAQKKAAAAAAEKARAKAAAATHQQITHHAAGHGQLE